MSPCAFLWLVRKIAYLTNTSLPQVKTEKKRLNVQACRHDAVADTEPEEEEEEDGRFVR